MTPAEPDPTEGGVNATDGAHARFLAALLRLARLPASLGTPSEQIAAATQIAADTLAVERVGVWFYDDARTLIRCDHLFERTHGCHTAGMELTRSDYPIYFAALEQERTLVIERADQHPATAELAVRHLSTQGVISLLDAPIFREGRVAGVVCHEHIGTIPRHWRMEEVQFSSSVADIMALIREQGERRGAEAELALQHHRLAQAQKMEALGRMAGGVAHDFNNILTAILGYADRMRQSAHEPQSIRDLAKKLTASAQRAAGLTRQLLAFSRHHVASPGVIDLNHAIRGMDHILRSLLGDRSRLVLELAPKLPGIRIDATHLEQVLLNVAVNAADAMPSGGVLTISTMVEITDGATYALLRFADTGVGMTTEVRSRMFEPFFTTKPHGVGTGLGLATVYGIATQAGGLIDVQSEPGQGTVFTLLLPATDRPADPGQTPGSGHAIIRGNETVLLVEDDDSNRELLVEALRDCGFAVLPASDGWIAKELLASHHDDIALLATDVAMPRLGGMELARLARISHPGLPVLFISGFVDGMFDPASFGDGPIELLSKPFRLEAFIGRIRSLLDTKQQA